MSFDNLHNPRAAAELISDFRKRFNTKTCMAPHAEHSGSIVAAHTLSVGAVLRKLAIDSHVYAPSLMGNFAPNKHPIQIKRLGLRDVSTFNGFCEKHDVELFSCIENEPLRLQRKQNFMLAYRAAARECYLKRKQCESLPEPEQIQAIHGITPPLTYSEETLIFQAASLRGAEEAEAFKSKLDGYLLQSEWNRLVTHAVLFKKTPSVTASFVFQPFHDMNGSQLQDYENLEADMSQLAVSLIPLEQGGAAIFSWLDSANPAPRRYFESVIQSKDLTSAVVHTVLDNSENFAFSPTWYEQLSSETQDYLFSRIALLEVSIIYSMQPRPETNAPFLDDWGTINVAQF